MQLSQLSDRAGVSLATVKFYLREGLLPPGTPVAATRAEYGEQHLHRLRLVRALVEVGGLSLSAVRRVLRAVDAEDVGVHELLGAAHQALTPTVAAPADGTGVAAARSRVDALIGELGWRVSPDAPARSELAAALVALERLAMPATESDLRTYAAAAHDVARHDVATVPLDGPRARTVEWVVLATVLYEPVLLALRRLAQEHESARRTAPVRRGPRSEKSGGLHRM